MILGAVPLAMHCYGVRIVSRTRNWTRFLCGTLCCIIMRGFLIPSNI